jgi:PAS domain S-box-containing protein
MASRLEGEDAVARLAAQQTVAHELFRAETLERAAPGVLGAVATALSWEAAALWEVDADAGALALVGTWDSPPGAATPLWEASSGMLFGRGTGLPGRTWATGELNWITDLSSDPNFPRRDAAAQVGLCCGLAVPVPAGPADDVVAVMEFFTSSFVEPDTDLQELLVGFGDQLAQFVHRRRAEREASESAALNSAILASVLDCVITIDHRGRIVEFNPAAERLFGHTRERALGQELAELIVPPDAREAHRAGLRRYLADGVGPLLDRRIEVTGLAADGSEIPVELTVTVIPGTKPPMFTGYLRDIAPRRAGEMAQRRLAAIVESTQDAILTKDTEGIVTSWNAGAERLYGYTPEQAVGRHISFVIPPDRRGEENMILGRVLAGERLESYETERIRADGVRVDVSLTVSPLPDPQRGITGASVIARDITALKRSARAQSFLASASAALDASLHPGETLRTIVRTAVPDLAELCVIDLVREDGSIGGAVAAGTDPALARELEDLRRIHPLDPAGRHPVARVLRGGGPLVLRDLSTPEVVADVAQSEAHREFMIRAGYNSAAVVPMQARGRLLGAISLLHVRNDRRYDAEDLALLEDMASRAALAYDNARLYGERTHIARTLQQSLMPAVLPTVPGCVAAASYQPAGEGNEVGGDFYDLFAADADWNLVVGDVCGKGAEAAAVTALIRNSFRALSLVERSPAAILSLVNDVMLRSNLGGRFATAALGRLLPSPPGFTLRLAVAGHPSPVVLSKDGHARAVGRPGDLLGVHRDARFTQADLHLQPGDTAVLFTDGVLDAGAPDSVLAAEDVESLLAQCAGLSTREIVQFVERHTLRASRGAPRDDLAILAVTISRSRG